MKKKTLRTLLCIALCILLSVPAVPVIVYESIFCRRYETPQNLSYSMEDMEGISCTRSDFESDGVTLAGYLYQGQEPPKGIVVFAHGMGGGGHISYYPMVEYLVRSGFAAFAYDARGNDESAAKPIGGLPQGVIDLDHAITHVKNLTDLPIYLVGHSWGGYSVGCALNLHPDVEAAVILAGFNESEDLLRYQGQQHTGTKGNVMVALFDLYEQIKFGDYANLTALDGMGKTDADILIVHSMDDETVPTACGYDLFYEEFGNEERCSFLLYEDKGHGYLFCSDESLAAQERAGHDVQTMDRDQCFQVDEALMEQIVQLFTE